ncbi:endonuclease/exonuclease/phosphatase family protein [Solwaraspora sp. WMMD1047]|uniref:endonuclease/exonuclease/phosphatase family protein n=1 Tax=Solwaraspora sp. WMMD1047 TaxID=3016102 RepID=UPI002415B86C|nr:endonuclease/exonuclease/phosphatase family protein [Solwaraspora sp. WMMD1047]MDG4832519.1 endonuclease/exonuclease/phosphatase family protein [Solwaraspora sp. WMMD1047]
MSLTIRRVRRVGARALLAAAVTLAAIPAASAPAAAHGGGEVRFATFNASLNRGTAGALRADLSTPDNAQAGVIAEIVQRTRPDVLLVNEFDYDPLAAKLFQDNYLSVGRNGATPIRYPYRFIAPSNTGVASGFDLNNDGAVVTEPGAPGYGDDALGFGAFPGQYGMVVYSRYPIDHREIRTFQKFRWKDMPGALLPDDPATVAPADWYSPQELRRVRLSSKSHWDLPVRIGRQTVHFLVSHPTPPVFDGPEDRNGRRNFDEIRFWADYVRPGAGRYIYDDRGGRGGLRPGSAFVIAGDLNSDPLDGDSIPGAAQQLLESPWVNARSTPSSAGAVEAAAAQGGANATHRSDPAYDTADFADVPGPGNVRADYVLPSRRLPVRGSGVFWPTADDPLSRLTGTFPFPSSDHRLVWLDLRVGR